MENWFYNPNIQFHMWDSSHLLTIFIIVVLLILIFTLRKRLTPFRRPIRLIIGVLLILSRLSLDLWYITTDQWTAHSSLPLELFSIASLIDGLLLLNISSFHIIVI